MMSKRTGENVHIDQSLAGMLEGAANWHATRSDYNTTIMNSGYEPQALHIAMGRASIMQDAQLARKRTLSNASCRALVLGVGRCRDIPAAGLLEMFDHVTFVDIDPAGTEQALQEIPGASSKNTTVIGADLTGISAEFASTTDVLAARSETYEDFLAAAEYLLKHTKVMDRQPKLGSDYAFVSSHLVLSELAYFAYGYLTENIIKPTYDVEPEKNDPTMFGGYNYFRYYTTEAHFAYLKRLVAEDGIVHFADTYTGHTSNVDNMILSSKEVTRFWQEAGFGQNGPTTQWMWQKNDNRRYTVMSNALVPKSADKRKVDTSVT